MLDLLQRLKNVRDGVFIRNRKSTVDEPKGDRQKRIRKESQVDFDNTIKAQDSRKGLLPYNVSWDKPRRLYRKEFDE